MAAETPEMILRVIEAVQWHISLSHDSSSVASTETLLDVSTPERLSRWPSGPFPIPTFSFIVELMLREGNNEF